jgi:hypothetical protein
MADAAAKEEVKDNNIVKPKKPVNELSELNALRTRMAQSQKMMGNMALDQDLQGAAEIRRTGYKEVTKWDFREVIEGIKNAAEFFKEAAKVEFKVGSKRYDVEAVKVHLNFCVKKNPAMFALLMTAVYKLGKITKQSLLDNPELRVAFKLLGCDFRGNTSPTAMYSFNPETEAQCIIANGYRPSPIRDLVWKKISTEDTLKVIASGARKAAKKQGTGPFEKGITKNASEAAMAKLIAEAVEGPFAVALKDRQKGAQQWMLDNVKDPKIFLQTLEERTHDWGANMGKA